ncbi:MAG: DUF1043 family protein [Psychromonas sp.]|nr:DUF1043 family protein [Psychromonas sp.]
MTELNMILIFLAGGIIGFAICYITAGRKQSAAQQKELHARKSELDDYKSQVNNHFTKSAELMREAANSYQALYTHLASQSQVLLSDSDADALPFPQIATLSEDKQDETLKKTEIAQATPEAKKETAETEQTEASETDSDNATEEQLSETSEAAEEQPAVSKAPHNN